MIFSFNSFLFRSFTKLSVTALFVFSLQLGKTITSGGKKLIAEILRANVAYLDVQIRGCRLLAALATTGTDENST